MAIPLPPLNLNLSAPVQSSARAGDIYMGERAGFPPYPFASNRAPTQLENMIIAGVVVSLIVSMFAMKRGR